MEKDFLHKISLESLQKELGMSIEDIGKYVNLKNPKGVYKWSKDSEDYGTRPSYNALIRLLQKGATVETLFGVEYEKKVFEKSKKIRICTIQNSLKACRNQLTPRLILQWINASNISCVQRG